MVGVVWRAAKPASGHQQRPGEGGAVVGGEDSDDLRRCACLRPQDADQRDAGFADQLGVHSTSVDVAE
jgi:hypothetical protein